MGQEDSRDWMKQVCFRAQSCSGGVGTPGGLSPVRTKVLSGLRGPWQTRVKMGSL